MTKSLVVQNDISTQLNYRLKGPNNALETNNEETKHNLV